MAARLLQLKVHGRCLQAGMPLAVRIFGRPAWSTSYGIWYSKESPRTKVFVVRFRSVQSTSAMKKGAAGVTLTGQGKVPGGV